MPRFRRRQRDLLVRVTVSTISIHWNSPLQRKPLGNIPGLPAGIVRFTSLHERLDCGDPEYDRDFPLRLDTGA